LTRLAKFERSGPGQSGFGYTGEQMDPTGLVFLRARYYDPSVGRFLTPDTIVPDPLRSMGWNQYAYGYNNPIGYADPSGKNPLLCVELVIADGPLPVGDIACAALIGYTLATGYTLAQNADLPSGSLSVNVPSAAEVVQTVLAINAASTVLINEIIPCSVPSVLENRLPSPGRNLPGGRPWDQPNQPKVTPPKLTQGSQPGGTFFDPGQKPPEPEPDKVIEELAKQLKDPNVSKGRKVITALQIGARVFKNIFVPTPHP
jgi:RHS repeat-associated protein